MLSRSIAELGIYPAVDPLDSTSRMLSARILGLEHYDTARAVQRVLQVSISLWFLPLPVYLKWAGQQQACLEAVAQQICS